MSEALGFKIKKIKAGILKIGSETFVGQDTRGIYKLCCEEFTLKTEPDFD